LSEIRILDSDIVQVRTLNPIEGKRPLVATLFWGDQVKVVGKTTAGFKVEIPTRTWNPESKRYDRKNYNCLLPKKTRFRDDSLFKLRIVDVGQGDGAIIESPKGHAECKGKNAADQGARSLHSADYPGNNRARQRIREANTDGDTGSARGIRGKRKPNFVAVPRN